MPHAAFPASREPVFCHPDVELPSPRSEGARGREGPGMWGSQWRKVTVHRFPFFVVILALVLTGPVGTAAQQATPDTSGSTLAALGYPELVVRVNGDAIELPETTIPAGRTLVRLENVGQESWHGFMLQVPGGVTDEQVVADLGPNAEAPPPWLFEAIYPGFPGETLPGQTSLALVDLRPGRYLVLGDTVQQFEVVGDVTTPGATPAAQEPIADATVRLFEYNFQ